MVEETNLAVTRLLLVTCSPLSAHQSEQSERNWLLGNMKVETGGRTFAFPEVEEFPEGASSGECIEEEWAATSGVRR